MPWYANRAGDARGCFQAKHMLRYDSPSIHLILKQTGCLYEYRGNNFCIVSLSDGRFHKTGAICASN